MMNTRLFEGCRSRVLVCDMTMRFVDAFRNWGGKKRSDGFILLYTRLR